LARGSFGSDVWFTHVYTLDRPDVINLTKANPGANGREVITFDNRTIPINAQGQLEGIDPAIKPYKSREFSVSLDHQFSSKLIGGIRYTRKDLIRASPVPSTCRTTTSTRAAARRHAKAASGPTVPTRSSCSRITTSSVARARATSASRSSPTAACRTRPR